MTKEPLPSPDSAITRMEPWMLERTRIAARMHDINGALGIIIARSEMVGDEMPEKSKGEEIVSSILTQVDQLGGVMRLFMTSVRKNTVQEEPANGIGTEPLEASRLLKSLYQEIVLLNLEISQMPSDTKEKCREFMEAIIKAVDRAKVLCDWGADAKEDKLSEEVSLSRFFKENKSLLEFYVLGDPKRRNPDDTRTLEIPDEKETPDISVVTDINKLWFAIQNLVVNARDALPAGSGSVKITLGRKEITGSENGLPDGRYVGISVIDTGSGMDEETKARIFERFFSTKGERGTGLGLPIVEQFARDNNGSITVESEPGKGSTFTILLPELVKEAKEKLEETAVV